MKTTGISCAMLFCFLTLSTAEPAEQIDEFTKCRETYNDIVEYIKASSGEEAIEGIWQLLFHDLDLDGNEQVTSPEIALFLEKEDYVHETDVMEVMMTATQWIKVADGGDEQLSRNEFMKLIQMTIKQSPGPEKHADISRSVCHLFTIKVPHIVESMTVLQSCTKHLEESILADKSEQAEFNSWLAIFETLDINQDKKIDFDELKKSIGHSLTDADDIALANALGHAIYGTVHHDVKDITEKNFYKFIHELLYGSKKNGRRDAWVDISSENELRGREMMCLLIRDVRTLLTKQRDIMDDCIKSYKATRKAILGADGVFAPEIVFTMADADRNGEISHKEFDAFIGAQSTLYNLIERKHATKEVKIEQFRSIMPDKIVVAKERNDAKSVLESSSMTSSQLKEAENLCSAIILSVRKYPTHIEHSEEINELERHVFVSPDMSFKGPGEYIMHEHTLPDASTLSPQDTINFVDHKGENVRLNLHHVEVGEDVSTPPPSNSKGPGEYTPREHALPAEEPTNTPNNSGKELNKDDIIYHMIDAEGKPINLFLDRIEIDDISHRIALAKELPVEPISVTAEVKIPVKTEEGSELALEIEKIIREKTETPETVKPKPESPQSNEENELKELLSEMEGLKIQ